MSRSFRSIRPTTTGLVIKASPKGRWFPAGFPFPRIFDGPPTWCSNRERCAGWNRCSCSTDCSASPARMRNARYRVLQFLGKKVNQSGEIPGWFNGAVTTDFKRRQEGERVKYRLNGNSLKDYGKAHTPVGDVFRV